MGKYFKEEEFKCKCCGQALIHPKLIPTLDEIRESYGKPMVVTSGYRCRKHNDEVGGAPNSEHITGEGTDIKCETSGDRFKLVSVCILCNINRIGIGKNFVHIGISSDKPKGVIWLY